MSLRLIRHNFSAIRGARYWMRPCREPRRGGLVKTRAIVSDSQPECGSIMQMDTAGYRRFSGTQLRLGLRMNFHYVGFPSLPRSRWVTGAGPMTANLADVKIPGAYASLTQNEGGEDRPARLGWDHVLGAEMCRWIRFYSCKYLLMGDPILTRDP
jgi:hypothetical protein